MDVGAGEVPQLGGLLGLNTLHHGQRTAQHLRDDSHTQQHKTALSCRIHTSLAPATYA